MLNENKLDLTSGKSIATSVGGVAVVILTILGLANIYPIFLAAVAALVFGAALLFKSLAILAEYPKLLSRLNQHNWQNFEIASGASGELLAAGCGIILSILAVLGISPESLIAIAIIVYGCGMAIGSGVLSNLNALKLAISGADERVQVLANEMIYATASIQVLVGLAAVVLGIVSLLDIIPVTIELIALVALGATSLLNSCSFAGKVKCAASQA